MGFFVGWKYFDEKDRYSPEHYREQQRQRDEQRVKEWKKEKKRRLKQKERRLKKKQKREEWRAESEMMQSQFHDQYSNSQFAGGQGSPSSDYDKFSGENKDAYRDEIMRRYGYLYNSSSEDKTPTLGRGLGASAHQKIKMKDGGRQHHTALGPMGQLKKKPPPGCHFPGLNAEDDGNDPQGGGNNSSGSGNQGGGTPPLSRPV